MTSVTVINIHAAQPIGDNHVTPVEIVIIETLPDLFQGDDVSLALKAQDAFCDAEAQNLEEALVNSLPGATYDRLLAKMMLRKASHLRVINK